MEFMGCSAVNYREIHDGMAREYGKVSNEVLDIL